MKTAMILVIGALCCATLRSEVTDEAASVKPAVVPVPILAEISLRDGSTLFCTIQPRTLPFAPAFTEKLSVPLRALKLIDFADENNPALIHFRNDDRLTATPLYETISVDSLLGRFEIDVLKIKRIVIKTQPGNTSAGLVYWCTFESEASIRKPAAGPEGEYHSGLFVDGKMGNALKTDGAKLAMAVNLPSGAFRNKGCIEFWARIDDPTRPFSGGGCPTFFYATTDGGRFWLEFNINNGSGMGGLCAEVAARPCGIPRSFSGSPRSYSTVLKDNPGGWHHYALVWNEEGLKNINASDGHPATFAVLLDGTMYSSRNFEGKPGSFARIADGPVLFCIPDPNANVNLDVAFSIDELKIWNYDKTEFELNYKEPNP